MKISTVLFFGEVDFLHGEDVYNPSAEWGQIQNRLISALPPKLRRLHISECVEMIIRDDAAALLAGVLQHAPLEGFEKLILMGVNV